MSEKPTGESRRDFLKLAVAAPTTAVAAVVSTPGDAAAETAAAGAGLRKTPHVEAYLKSARF